MPQYPKIAKLIVKNLSKKDKIKIYNWHKKLSSYDKRQLKKLFETK